MVNDIGEIEPPRQSTSKWRLVYICSALIVAILAIVSTWLIFKLRGVVSPFSPKILSSVDFPLYYPTNLPSGYHIDSKSVTEPQSGSVVFTMYGPQGQKLYMSQESRPSNFNFGGYYKNFADLKTTVITPGTIAVGHINNGRTAIGSLATNKTWIIVDTVAPMPLNQLTDMLNSLVVSH